MVLYEAAQEGLAFSFPLEESADGLLHLYLFGVPSAAYLVHERREVAVLNVLVYLGTFLGVAVSLAHFLIPFPAAAMAEEHEDVLSFGSQTLRQFSVQYLNTPEHLFVGDVQTLERFDEDVAEAMVEGFLDAQYFRLAFLGEGTGEVLSHKSPPIPYYIIYKGESDVAQDIQEAKGQSCQEPHEVVFLLGSVLVHYC